MAIFYFLQDILENEDVKLDHMFIASLVADIVKVCLMNGKLQGIFEIYTAGLRKQGFR